MRLAQAEVDLGAIIDYAASFGVVAMTRAYADWSVPANAAYRKPLVDRAVDLVQLFAAAGTKNGADIRLAVDAVEDLSRHPDITHVALVAGDSDFVPLAQRCKRMGRFVVGIGVAGSTSRALVNACDEFQPLRGAARRVAATTEVEPRQDRARQEARPDRTGQEDRDEEVHRQEGRRQEGWTVRAARADRGHPAAGARRLRVGLQKSDDEWIYASGVKSQMQRMNPAFKEKALGYSSFRAFVESRASTVETKVHDNGQLLVRLR